MPQWSPRTSGSSYNYHTTDRAHSSYLNARCNESTPSYQSSCPSPCTLISWDLPASCEFCSAVVAESNLRLPNTKSSREKPPLPVWSGAKLLVSFQFPKILLKVETSIHTSGTLLCFSLFVSPYFVSELGFVSCLSHLTQMLARKKNQHTFWSVPRATKSAAQQLTGSLTKILSFA